jgi:hypothetical protein
MAEEDPADTVGYRRPPRNRQFKPGQSGNPKGRPKGARNFATAIAAELNAPIFATENGIRKRITKRQAVAKQLVNKAVAGDTRAIPLLLNETRLQETAAGDTQPVLGGAADDLVMASILRRIRAADAEATGGRPTTDRSADPQSEGSAAPAQDLDP